MQAIRTARPLTRRLNPSSTLSLTTSSTSTSPFLSSASFSSSSVVNNASTTAATSHGHGHGHDLHAHVLPRGGGTGDSIIPLSNIQAQWEQMTEGEQALVHRQLEELQKKDWRSLSLDEKRAAYYVSFGPHGTRVPATKPGEPSKVVFGVIALIGATGLLWATVRSYAHEPPRTLNKQWQEASNEKAKEQKMNPITGIASEGYKGKGFVVDK